MLVNITYFFLYSDPSNFFSSSLLKQLHARYYTLGYFDLNSSARFNARTEHLIIDADCINITPDHDFSENASDSIRYDHFDVLTAVKHDDMILEHVSDILKDDYEVLLGAVKQNAFALNYASYKL